MQSAFLESIVLFTGLTGGVLQFCFRPFFLHLERTVEAEKELKSEAKKEEAQEEALKEKAVSNVAAQEVRASLPLCVA